MRYINFNLLAVFLIFTACSEPCEQSKKQEQNRVTEHTSSLKELEFEYKSIDSVEYLERYIEKVIKEGSNQLGFKAGAMQAGFVDEDTARDIAHYVVTLSKKDCKDHDMAQKAKMYYTSNCGGCHGDDGKGLNGAYPDLTKEMLLGIKKREEFLRDKIKTFKGQL